MFRIKKTLCVRPCEKTGLYKVVTKVTLNGSDLMSWDVMRTQVVNGISTYNTATFKTSKDAEDFIKYNYKQ